jgi:hypothetical protein
MTQTAELTAPGRRRGDIGFSVSISCNTIVAGAPSAALTNVDSGAAYVFVEPAGGWVNMTPTAKLVSSSPKKNDQLGTSVAISGDSVIAGLPQSGISGEGGAAYLFLKPPGGWVSITQTLKLTASKGQTDDQLGFSVSVSDKMVVSGAINGGAGNGAAYVFGNTE